MRNKWIKKVLALSTLLVVALIFGSGNYALAAPVTSISLNGTMGDNGWYTSDVTVTLTATDTASSVTTIEYSLNGGGSWLTYSSPFTISNEGYYNILARARDNAGNLENPVARPCNIDRTAPVTSISLGGGPMGNNGWYLGDVTVTLTATDNVSCTGATPIEYSLNGGSSWLAYDGVPFNISIEGTNTVLARVRNNAGILESPPASMTVKIDKTAPVLTIAANPTDIDKVKKAVAEPKVKVLNDNGKGKANNGSNK